MSQLFSPVQLGALTLSNRVVIPPMCQYSATEAGYPTDWHLMHLGNMALSSAGLLIIEATAVEPSGRITPYDLGIWDDDQAASLKTLIARVRQYSHTRIGIQLAHAGRKASSAKPWLGGEQLKIEEGGWQTIAPSAQAFADRPLPETMTQERIRALKTAFITAAQRAVAAGIDLIEIHAAHGYLLHEFLSPLSNLRTDEYGGTLENRLRLTLEVMAEVRAAVSAEVSVGVRISATDWMPEGWDLAQAQVLAQRLQAQGCDFIHVSSGGLAVEQQIPVGPSYQVSLAQGIRQVVTMPVIAVGLITEAEQAESIIATGQADLIAVGRGILYDPRWPWHAAARLGASLQVAPQYLRSEPRHDRGVFKPYSA